MHTGDVPASGKSRTGSRPGFLWLVLTLVVGLYGAYLVLLIGSSEFQRRGDRDDRLRSVIGQAFMVGHVDYFSNTRSCNLLALGLSLPRLRQIAANPRAHGFIFEGATPQGLRRLLADPRVRSIGLADAARDRTPTVVEMSMGERAAGL